MTIDLTPAEFRRLGYQAVDLIAKQLENVREQPVRRPVPDQLREAVINQPLPVHPTDPDDLIQRFADEVLPYPMGNPSPRFMGWVNPPPAPLGIIADLLAAGLNPSVAGGDHAATYVEYGVLNWMKEIMRFPLTSGALLTSGGSTANLVALGAMRYHLTGGSDRSDGFYPCKRPFMIYSTIEGHSCLQKAVEILGFGSRYLRRLPVDSDYQMDMNALRHQIAQDRRDGLEPACVIASAGTVNSGAIDPMNEIADICAEENLWFHVDGSYGGVGILAPQTEGLYAGIERADSLAIDPHKWLYVPVECGCVLVRDAQLMREAFSLVPSYLRDDRLLPWLSELGLQLTRGFRALKLWMVFQQIGVQGYRELIGHDIEMAHRLQEKIRDMPDFELVSAGPLSITCFRYTPPGIKDIDALNRALIPHLQNSGVAFFSSAELSGRPVLRACIVNFRTTEADLDLLLKAVKDSAQKAL